MVRLNERLAFTLYHVLIVSALLVFFPFHQVWGQACVPPPNDLVSWWPGDGNAEDIASDHHGTLQNGTTFAAGQVDQAFSFDGVDDYVAVPDDPSLRAINAVTIDFWANFNKVPRGGTFADNLNLINKVDDYYVMWRADLNLLQISLTDACDGLHHLDANVSLPSLQPGEWHHYAVVAVDGGATGPEFHIYFDGVEQPYVPGSPPGHASCGFFTGPTGGLHIGRLASPTAPPMYFDGLIDEVEIFNRALSASEIQSIYNAGSAGKCKEITTAIDIMPGSDMNPVNPKSKGVIPVAILTTDTFDATTVNPLSIKFGPNEATESHNTGHIEDVDGDTDLDLLLHFHTPATGIQCGDTSAALIGHTWDGDPVAGSDSITTVACP